MLDRAQPFGINLGELARATTDPLADIRLENPFVETARLFTEVRAKEKQAREIVEQVVQASSEDAALQGVQDIREELAPVGPPPKASSRETTLARAAIGNLVKFEGRPSAAFDPRKREEGMARWERLSQVVEAVIEALRTYQAEMPNA